MPKKDYSLHNKVNTDPRLSLRAKGLMFYLLSKPIDWKGQTYDIIKYCKDGKQSVLSAIKELKQCGYVRTVATSKNGIFTGKHYRVIYKISTSL